MDYITYHQNRLKELQAYNQGWYTPNWVAAAMQEHIKAIRALRAQEEHAS